MQTYSQFRPTGFDPAGAFLPEHGNWLVVPCWRNRDSGPLDESNFETALEMLGGESDTVEVHRFGHWANGWFELILVDPADKERAAIVESIESSLADYPVLSDEDHSRREYEAYLESWDSYGRREYERALCKEDYEDCEGFTGAEIAEEVSDFTAEEIDKLVETARHAVNWEYQSTNEGVDINIKGLVDKTDWDAVVTLAVEGLREKQFQGEVKKLGAYLGACASEIQLAIRQRINSVSGFHQLMQGTI